MTIKILNKKNNKKLSILFLTIIAILNFFTSSLLASEGAKEYGINRIRSCSSEVAENEFSKPPFNKEFSFDAGNTVCAVTTIGLYLTFKALLKKATKACAVPYNGNFFAPQPWKDFKAYSQCNWKGSMSVGKPCGSSAIAMNSFALLVFADISVKQQYAKENYKNTKICGDGWVNAIDPDNLTADLNGEKKTRATKFYGYLKASSANKIDANNKEHREWYYDGVEVEDNPVGGEDYCIDQTNISKGRQKYYMRGLMSGNFNCNKYDYEKYEKDPVNLKDWTPDRILEFKSAYDCCVDRSKNYICINSFNKDYFCKSGGKKCKIDHSKPEAGWWTEYRVFKQSSGRLICAESYSWCPYNFSIGGGTDNCDLVRDGITKGEEYIPFHAFSKTAIKEYKDTGSCNKISEARNSDCSFKNSFNKCKNYCQYLRHCTIPPNANNSPYKSSLSSPYFPQACYDFIGDSKNGKNGVSGVSADLYLKSVTNFTTPIVQCFRETIENIFYNRYGKSYCSNDLDRPTSSGDCSSGYKTIGTSEMKMGNKVNERSFFQILQEQMLNVVKATLSFAVMFLGFKILLGVGSIKKPELLVFLLKISLVVYFVMGNAWQSVFFDGVYRASEYASRLVFNVAISDDPEKIDGCQFGRVLSNNGSIKQVGTYPANKEYLAIWDTIDCKIARYLGVSDSSMSAIGKMIAGNLLSSFLPITAWLNKAGIFLSFLFMIFGCILIATAIRALHVFISSAFLIILLVYISPIIIPLCLFKRTEDIYNAWLKTLLGTAIQPIVLFAYLGIFISVLDYSVIGDGRFMGGGSGKMKVLDCEGYCADDDNIYQKKDGIWYTNGIKSTTEIKDNLNDECPIISGKLSKAVYPINSSVACVIDFATKPNAFVDWPGFSFIGLFFKTILLPTNGKVKMDLVTLEILRCIMIIFVLSSFMDEIPGIGKALLGGGLVSSSKVTGVDVAKTMFKSASLATMVSNVARSKGKDFRDLLYSIKNKNSRK